MANIAEKQQCPPAVLEIVQEIMSSVRSLPPRPSLDEVDAAMAVVKSVKSEELGKLEEVAKMERPPDVPEELFGLLQQVKKNMVFLQSEEQRKEAMCVIDLDKRFLVFDELILRASRLVFGEEVEEKDISFHLPVVCISEEESRVTDEGDLQRTEEALTPKLFKGSSSEKASYNPGEDAEKLNLMKVANMIEISAKKGSDILDLRGRLVDQLEWLPQSLGKLSTINKLILSDNKIMALPSSISNRKCLTKFDIHSNQLINLPYSFGELSSLVELDLHANLLRSMPALIGKLTNLVYLDVSSNKISLLPDAFGDLTNLKCFNAEANDLVELPHTIGSCISLVELRLDFNQLKALPEAVGKMENLELLTLHFNRVKGLPTTMGCLLKLRELDVSFNEIELVPESLCFATSALVKLNLGRNFADLRSLPRSIGNLKKLEELDISCNQIRFLQESFVLLSKLLVFLSDETPLEVPPRDVVKEGAQAVVQYMADIVAKSDMGEVVVEEKGCWSWFLSLFRSQEKSRTRNIDIVEA